MDKIPPGVGGHFRINLYGTCRFSGYHFSAKIPERGMKIDQKFRNGLWLFVQEQKAIAFKNNRLLFSLLFPVVL